jgi:hypothetical protein
MANDKVSTPSSLEKFSLSFEYDMTWQDAKKSIKQRTHTK